MRSTASVALICLLCGCICTGSDDAGTTATTLAPAPEGQDAGEGAPALKYEVKVTGSGANTVLSVINKNDFDWHTCYILVNGEYSDIVSEEYRADVTKDVPVGGSFDTNVNATLVNQYGKYFSGALADFELDCDQGRITQQVTTPTTTRKRTSG
jgi:hypothetical protein